jgi:uncharacterized protein
MDVIHDSPRHRFYIPLGAHEAVLQYARRGQALDVHHVFVPGEFRGRGLADQLAAYAFEYARRENMTIIPSCPFVASAFLPRHPQYQSLVRPRQTSSRTAATEE